MSYSKEAKAAMVAIASTNCCFIGFLASTKLGKRKTIATEHIDKIIAEL